MSTAVSVIITSFNYARFLRATIDSALDQTLPETEVIVVDDGSVDDSPAIIRSYDDRVTPLLKQNGGQGSAFNAGFAASSGDVVIFLDSDDLLAPRAAERAADRLRPGIAKAHWPLRQVDQHGRPTGRSVPAQPLPEGDLREIVLRDGPAGYLSPPTTGNAWSRDFLEKVLPLPEADYRTCPDAYLTTLAPLFGAIEAIDEPLGSCRVHARNEYNSRTPVEKNRTKLELYDRRCELLAGVASALALSFDASAWKDGNSHYAWMKSLEHAAREIEAAVPEGQTFVLVDDDWWNDGAGNPEVLPGRHRLPFLERDGEYWGPPGDDGQARLELERLRCAGASFLVFAWSAFWWLEHYRDFVSWLRSTFACVVEDANLVIFDLRVSPTRRRAQRGLEGGA